MRLPVLCGTIERRILVNFRVEPDVLARLLPAPFRPQLVGGYGIAGICLIRLRGIRPRGWPGLLGFSSENAAHRIAVEWDDARGAGSRAPGAPVGRPRPPRRLFQPPAGADDRVGAVLRGVYVPRRDSSSRFNVLVGGRLFPGMHHLSRFDVREGGGNYHVAVSDRDGTRISVDGHVADRLPRQSIFGSLEEASAFFAGGSLGYSASRQRRVYDGLELRTSNWKTEPLEVDQVASSFFDDRRMFPAGSTAFDSAFLMRDIEHEWHGRESLCCAVGAADEDTRTVGPSVMCST